MNHQNFEPTQNRNPCELSKVRTDPEPKAGTTVNDVSGPDFATAGRLQPSAGWLTFAATTADFCEPSNPCRAQFRLAILTRPLIELRNETALPINHCICCHRSCLDRYSRDPRWQRHLERDAKQRLLARFQQLDAGDRPTSFHRHCNLRHFQYNHCD